MPPKGPGGYAATTVFPTLLGHERLKKRAARIETARARDGGESGRGRSCGCGPPMSDSDFTAPKPLVLRVEISAEQANAIAPLLGAGLPTPLPAASPAPLSDEVVDARVLELRQRESELEQREAEFEADVQFREDRIERWRTELEELEQTLDRRERDLVSYVDQLQGAMNSGNDAWWSRPAGGDGGVR